MAICCQRSKTEGQGAACPDAPAALAAEARVGAAGELVLLDDQDRARWDHEMIDEGLALVDRALGADRPGPYQVQAAIAALHAHAPRPEDTDWPQIAALYDALGRMAPTPVVALNHAVAVAMADGPERGLPFIDALAGELDGYHLFHAARADLLRRLDRWAEAADAYRGALELVTNATERATWNAAWRRSRKAETVERRHRHMPVSSVAQRERSKL